MEEILLVHVSTQYKECLIGLRLKKLQVAALRACKQLDVNLRRLAATEPQAHRCYRIAVPELLLLVKT